MRRLLALLIVAAMAGSAWGACRQSYTNYTRGWCNLTCNLPSTACEDSGILNLCGGVGYAQFLRNSCCGYGNTCAYYDVYCCDTQAEADSVNCTLNPTAEGCVQEIDTTLYFCKSEMPLGEGTTGGWKSYVFKCRCKAQNGTITSCNGKQNIDVTEDCTPYKSMDGMCAENGYPDGVSGSTDSTGANADCMATFNGDCYMKDRRSGNTFSCPCDGSCEYALRELMKGDGSCRNPYPQDEPQGDSIALPWSSSYDPPSSSSASPESAPSYGNELDALGGLYGVLDTIRDTLNRRIAPDVANIRANTQIANEYLQQIAAKEWSVNVNVDAPDVHVTNNTDVQGIENRQDRQFNADTAYQSRVLGALGALSDTAGAGNPNDTAGSGAALQSRLNQIDSAVGAYDVPDMSDSIAPTLQAVRGDIAAMRDSIAGGVIGDSVNAWRNAFLNNGVLSGDGSNTCPNVLTRQISFTFPHVGTIQAGTLGRYLCTPIAGFSVTLWQVARMLLRALVAIGCMWWLFKEVTGTTSGGSSDDD